MNGVPEGGAGSPPALRETDVFALSTAGMIEAARDYVLLDRVYRPRRRGTRLMAEVEGTDAIYRCSAEVTAGESGVPRVSPTCDCPSRRPYCKHVLALLWVWASDPAAFAPVDLWEGDLCTFAPADLAALLAEAAMGADPLALMRAAAAPPDWSALSPGRCLHDWDRFRSWAEVAGRWPEAALELGVRIAGAPRSAERGNGPTGATALGVRQLSWWLTRMVAVLPAPALAPWLEHLFRHLEVLASGATPPPELAVWLARLAAVLPEARAPERRWLAAFAAHAPTLAPVFEAELQRGRWEAEMTLRMAVAPAVPAHDPTRPTPLGSGYREALAAFEAERGAAVHGG